MLRNSKSQTSNIWLILFASFHVRVIWYSFFSLFQLLLCALLSECGRNDTALSNLLSNIAVELKSMPVVSTLLQALPRMLTLMSSSNDSDLVSYPLNISCCVTFQALHDLLKEEETTMKDNWKEIKEALTSTCQEILGCKKHHHKEWISIETLDKIKERKNKKTAFNNSRTRAEKVKAHAEYTEANKQVSRSIKADKQKYVGDLATTVKKVQEMEV
ncbi:unnamed protein product [Schistosoma mattheei]|uniref:Uncharacterized protein n=1 Tax=Schistosoma mattheei TaxID=31246 RepID=A0A183Q5G9_9TREM|nr:unnamed protein product [Schistosoma mattheei]